MKALILGMMFAAQAASADCVDYSADVSQLRSLEGAAMLGALSDGQKDCLETSYKTAGSQTDKDKISRVLLVNAYAYSTKYWAQLVQRHLDEVDRSDPDIAYLYAFYLYNTDKSRIDETLTWTQVALERKDTWTGATFVGRVYGLMRLRTLASHSMWQTASEDEAKGGKTSPADVEKLRARTKTYSREWVDFAKVAGKDSSSALKICLSVANQASACGEEG